jgi:CRISPR-associated endonuclease/helicase Cas3
MACSQTNGNAILISPTGSGKTESAMLWLRQQLTTHGQGRTFYILPFTASINAMYERLRKEIGEEKVGMLHGKLADYLYESFEENPVTTDLEALKKIRDKFKTIHTPLKIVTPFQLLKHLFGIKGFEQGIFEMAGGHFIFDEIHAYSPDTFAQIKWLIEYLVTYLQAKIFIMTATLPTFMRKELEAVIGKDNFTIIKAEESLYRQFNRHQLKLKSGKLTDEENIEEIIKSFDEKRKVLVVCNTVKSAQFVYQKLQKHAKSSVLLHGAFNGEDRRKHEKKLKEEIFLLVGTQAIEVSLDIDYDIIYTEPAPLDALIQRFGRINRRRKNSSCPVVVFDTANDQDHYIYDSETVNRTLEILKRIASENESIIQEVKLQEYIDEVYPCWTPKEEQVFNSTWTALQSLNISPLLYDKVSEDDFYSKFDGIKVLPEGLKDRFHEYLSNHDFIGAERLKVQIRKQKFASLCKTKSLLYPERYPLGKSKDVNYWVLRQKYDPLIGLMDGEQEVWHTEIL